MLTVWGRRSSYNLQKAMWLVDELGLDYNHVEVGGPFGGLDEPAFRAMNPHGKVPVIDDNGTVVWESHAILRYLAASYGMPQYWSENPSQRSAIDQWMDWAQTSLQPDFLVGIFWGFYRTLQDQRDLPTIKNKLKQCADHFCLLDNMLANQPFILGDKLTLADITIGTSLYRYFSIDIERPHIPNVEGLYARLKKRPAYRKHVMVPFDDLYGRLEF